VGDHLVGRPADVGQQHTVAGTGECDHRRRDRAGPSDRDDDAVGPDVNPVRPLQLLGEELAQPGVAAREGVLHRAGPERALHRLHDVWRSQKVGLAELEVDDSVERRCQVHHLADPGAPEPLEHMRERHVRTVKMSCVHTPSV